MIDTTHLPSVSPLEELCLTVLYNKSLYGLQIIQAVQECSNGREELTAGSLYPTLKRLEDKRLVESCWGESGPAARRKYYKLTEAGMDVHAAQSEFRWALRNWRPNNE